MNLESFFRACLTMRTPLSVLVHYVTVANSVYYLYYFLLQLLVFHRQDVSSVILVHHSSFRSTYRNISLSLFAFKPKRNHSRVYCSRIKRILEHLKCMYFFKRKIQVYLYYRMNMDSNVFHDQSQQRKYYLLPELDRIIMKTFSEENISRRFSNNCIGLLQKV